jgi:hypothetical protein
MNYGDGMQGSGRGLIESKIQAFTWKEITGYLLGCREILVRFPVGAKIFLFSTTSGSPRLPNQ